MSRRAFTFSTAYLNAISCPRNSCSKIPPENTSSKIWKVGDGGSAVIWCQKVSFWQWSSDHLDLKNNHRRVLLHPISVAGGQNAVRGLCTFFCASSCVPYVNEGTKIFLWKCIPESLPKRKFQMLPCQSTLFSGEQNWPHPPIWQLSLPSHKWVDLYQRSVSSACEDKLKLYPWALVQQRWCPVTLLISSFCLESEILLQRVECVSSFINIKGNNKAGFILSVSAATHDTPHGFVDAACQSRKLKIHDVKHTEHVDWLTWHISRTCRDSDTCKGSKTTYLLLFVWKKTSENNHFSVPEQLFCWHDK